MSSVLSGALVSCTIGDTALGVESRTQLVSILNLTATTLISMEPAALCASPPCGNYPILDFPVPWYVEAS